MGAGVSAGENNDDLINNLIDASYIKTPLVERVFRAVDRGLYLLPDPFVNPYRDAAWRGADNYHVSAPCIYSVVMEGLDLKPGLSFLNIGSGTGYLSTMVGLILGSNGINHGIEIHENVVDYAHKKLDEFKKHSGALDEFDFCDPKFVVGNCLNIASGTFLYDRAYCGAACPETHVNYMTNLIKVGGILIVPINDQLLQMKRVSETNWTRKNLLPVTFANLIQPSEGPHDMVRLADIDPLSLQEMCRSSIRDILRKIVEIENPDVTHASKPPKRKKRAQRKETPRKDRQSRGDAPELIDFFLLAIPRRKNRVSANSTGDSDDQDEEDDEDFQNVNASSSSSDNQSTEDSSSSSHSVSSSSSSECDDIAEEPANRNHAMEVVDSSSEDEEVPQIPKTSTALVEINQIIYNKLEKKPSDESNQEASTSSAGTSQKPQRKNRKKSDSGLGDELEVANNVDMVETLYSDDSSSSSDEDDVQDPKRCKRSPRPRQKSCNVDNNNAEFSEYDDERSRMLSKMYKSPYTTYMENKIRQLPLPPILKNYLLLYRD